MTGPREVAARAWSARHRIELQAAERFAHLARRLAAVKAPAVLRELADRASRDELRHGFYCREIALRHGARELAPPPAVLEYAPRSLSPLERLVYDLVAQSCVAETESTTTLLNLVEAVEDPALLPVLRELARDEVQHARLGWASLAWASDRLDLSFLAPLLPKMIAGSAGPEVFAGEGPDDLELYRYGVVPHGTRRRLYAETLREVIFPGFEGMGIDTAAAQRWLEVTDAAA